MSLITGTLVGSNVRGTHIMSLLVGKMEEP